MNQSQPDWVAGQKLLGNYVVEGVLGEGGMGRVYLVRSELGGNQFAVKRAFVKKEFDRRNFLAELQTWIDLPDHPNLTACRFFRSLDDEILIFAEYVAGGTLHSWIRERKLATLEQILDVAIQFAWGLHVAHERGVIHQDVKPANVLLTPDGVVKISDFGLARARERSLENSTAGLQSVLVSSGGMTPAYCSPEQKAGRPLDRRTDIWSWGVSVLEIFYGSPPCAFCGGDRALEVLDAYVESGSGSDHLPAMPDGMAKILRRCFNGATKSRWRDLSEVVAVLMQVYQDKIGREYPWELTNIQAQRQPEQVRHTPAGKHWDNPRQWLERALKAEGKDPAEADKIIKGEARTRQAQLVGDLAVFDEARQKYERLIQQGREELECDLAKLCTHKAFVHVTADDLLGAVSEHNRAVKIYEQLVVKKQQRYLLDDLASAYMNKAITLECFGDAVTAADLFDRAICIWKDLVDNKDGIGRKVYAGEQSDLVGKLATAYSNKAHMVSALGDYPGALTLCDRALALWERMVAKEGQNTFLSALAHNYTIKAYAVLRTRGLHDDESGAVALYDKAIEILERLVFENKRWELADRLAEAYSDKADLFDGYFDRHAAPAWYDRAIEIRERLVKHEGRHELAAGLAQLYLNKALSLAALGDNQGATALNDQAIEIWERLVKHEGRPELAIRLAQLYTNKAVALAGLGDNHSAAATYDKAIEIREQLINLKGRQELGTLLASNYSGKALALIGLGDNHTAADLCDQSIEIWERLVNKGQYELITDLTTAYSRKASALGDTPEAVATWDRAIEVLEHLEQLAKPDELLTGISLYEIQLYLASAYADKADIVSEFGANDLAATLYSKTIEIGERFFEYEKGGSGMAYLARIKACHAGALIRAGDVANGIRAGHNAIEALQAEIARNGETDNIREALDWITGELKQFT